MSLWIQLSFKLVCVWTFLIIKPRPPCQINLAVRHQTPTESVCLKLRPPSWFPLSLLLEMGVAQMGLARRLSAGTWHVALSRRGQGRAASLGPQGWRRFLPQGCVSAFPLPKTLPSSCCYGHLLSLPLTASSSEKPSLTIWLRETTLCQLLSALGVAAFSRVTLVSAGTGSACSPLCPQLFAGAGAQ